MRGEVSAVQAPSSKSSQTCQSHPWISIWQYQLIASWKAVKSPAVLNLTSKPQTLPWPRKSAEQQRWPGYSNGVREYRTYSLRQMRSLASYNKIPKQLLVGNMDYHSLNQEVRHIQLPVLTLVTCYCIIQSCLQRPTMGSTSNYLALL